MYTLLITFFLLAICFSFLCSMWEAVLLSVTPSYAEIKLKEGSSIGRRLKAFKENIDRPLAAILTLNTIAHTVGAIGVGEQSAQIWSDANPLITMFLIPAGMTLAILVLSEIIPKTLGAVFWKKLAPFTVISLSIVIKLLSPLVWMSQLITRSIKPDVEGSVFSRRDFLALTEIGAQQGVIEQGESDIINNLLRFDSVRAKDIMTPRTVVLAASADQSIRSFHDQHLPLRFSRVPIYQGEDKDRVIGFVLKHDILTAMLEGRGDEPLASLRRELLVIGEMFRLPLVFERLVAERSHIALVVDEFGGMEGVITMEDVIETLLGLEIMDESDHTEDMQRLARANWERRAKRMGLIESGEEGSTED